MRNHPALATLAFDLVSLDKYDSATTLVHIRTDDVQREADALLADLIKESHFTPTERTWFRSPIGGVL